MKQQILVIHGGDAHDSYEQYLETLRAKEVTLENLTTRGWKDNLQKDLGDKFEVISPRMPNPQSAKYEEWKIWFEKIIPLLSDNLILVGHSLGGIFLSKYLSENKFPHHIKKTLLVAAPYNTATEHPLADFNLSESLSTLEKQAGEVILYHSRDDVVVPYSNALHYKKDLPHATLKTFENDGHFNALSYPEILEELIA